MAMRDARLDLSTLSKNLKKDYGITKRRAEFIARDQANKAHATIERAKRQELGIAKAIWLQFACQVKRLDRHILQRINKSLRFQKECIWMANGYSRESCRGVDVAAEALLKGSIYEWTNYSYGQVHAFI